MQTFSTFDHFPEALTGGAVTIGKFDAVHLGHTLILQRTIEYAHRLGRPSLAVTFDPPPLEVLRPDLAPLTLCTLERKLQLFADAGIDAALVIPTDRAFLTIPAKRFFERIIVDCFHARILVEGESFTFGRDRDGNAGKLRVWGPAAGMEIEIVPSVRIDGILVSSSMLRELIGQGRVDEARRLMPRPYRLSGRVVSGDRRGRTFGFPTANLESVRTLLPRDGIYATIACRDNKKWLAATHIGPNLTFGIHPPSIESYLLDFDGDLYDEPLHLDFLTRIRDTVKFDSVESLVDRIRLDIQAIRKIGETLAFEPGLSTSTSDSNEKTDG